MVFCVPVEPLLSTNPNFSDQTRGRATALWTLSLAYGAIGDLPAATAAGEESVAIARDLGDLRTLADALFGHGARCILWPRPDTDDLVRGHASVQEAESLFWEVGNEAGQVNVSAKIAQTYLYQGMDLLAAGNPSEAELYLTRCLELATDVGDQYSVGRAQGTLGRLAWAQGNLARAHAHYDQALKYLGAVRHRPNYAWGLVRLGEILEQIGELHEARAHYAGGLQLLHEAGLGEISHQALCGLARLALEGAAPALALRLVSVSKSLALHTGVLPLAAVQSTLAYVESAARQALTPEAQAAAWDAGQAMSLRQVVDEALSAVAAEPAGA